MVVHFTNFCKPEKTFSGFRSDLVSCVKAVAFLSLKTTELQGLRVDIWGDSCEIGGVEVTRLAFRLLDVNISVQSTSSVFCFARKSILFFKISLMIISLRIAYFMNVRTPLINFIIKFSVPWKRQQIRDGTERWSDHIRRSRIGLVVQPNKVPKTVRNKADL